MSEQQAVSIIPRTGMRKVLGVLQARPGITSRELAQALGTQESAVSRNLRELSLSGIVARGENHEGNPAYCIRQESREHIAFALDRVKN